MHAHKRPLALAAAALLATLGPAACSPGDGASGEGGERGGPAITVEPLRGPAGTEVRVSARHFPADAVLDVGFGPPRSEYQVIARTRTGGDGSTAAVVRVPRDAAPGRPYVFVVAYPPTLVRVTSDTFRVTPEPVGGAMEPDTAGGVRVTGRLTDEGVECPALRGDDGQLYTLAGETGGFRPGDRVTVAGAVAEMSFCMQGTTISVRSIEAAGG
jgi:hypothetical protein